MRKPLIHNHCQLICCVYVKGHMSICVNAHCLMLEVLRYIALNALNTVQKMSKIDKVHIRGVRLCMSKMGKEHTHTFWLITSLILNGFSIRKSFYKVMFLLVSVNLFMVGVCLSACWDTTPPPPEEGTPPGKQTPHPPRKQALPEADPRPPYGQ